VTATVRPIRRSSLEAEHERLGARWTSDEARFPTDYGDPGGEAATAAGAIGLAEIGPLDALLVRGPGAAASVEAAGVDAGVWVLGPDEVLLLFRPAAGAADRLRSALGGADVALADLSSAWTVLRLAGPGAPTLLAELSPMALDPAELADGSIAQGPLVNVRAIVRRHDAPVGPGYTILVAREDAHYAWHAIVELGEELGLRPAGAAAVARANR
jgi:heterotetrameric sarcosine oxidase gamma subunit